MKLGPKRKIVRTENQDGMYVDVVLECGHTTTRRQRHAGNQDCCFCSECRENPDAQAEDEDEAPEAVALEEEVPVVVRIYDAANEQ